jgi:Amt family ammonium transporter
MKKILFLSLLISLLMAGVAFAQTPASSTSKVDSGDTAWLLISAALVMLMTPGLALFYGGMVRSKNVLGTIMQSFIAWASSAFSGLSSGTVSHSALISVISSEV